MIQQLRTSLAGQPEAQIAGLTNNLKNSEGVADVSADHAFDGSLIREVANKPEPLKPKDLAALVKYDKETGNILKYDPENRQLDDDSKSLLKDPMVSHIAGS